MNEMFTEREANIGLLMYAIGYLTQESKSQWIPVTEKLPENDSDYDIIVTYAEKDEKRIIPATYGHGTWFDCIFNRVLNPTKVLAWMPLPKPYEACKKENTNEELDLS